MFLLLPSSHLCLISTTTFCLPAPCCASFYFFTTALFLCHLPPSTAASIGHCLNFVQLPCLPLPYFYQFLFYFFITVLFLPLPHFFFNPCLISAPASFLPLRHFYSCLVYATTSFVQLPLPCFCFCLISTIIVYHHLVSTTTSFLLLPHFCPCLISISASFLQLLCLCYKLFLTFYSCLVLPVLHFYHCLVLPLPLFYCLFSSDRSHHLGVSSCFPSILCFLFLLGFLIYFTRGICDICILLPFSICAEADQPFRLVLSSLHYI